MTGEGRDGASALKTRLAGTCLGLAIALGLLVVACGGDGGQASTPTLSVGAGAASPTPETPAATVEPTGTSAVETPTPGAPSLPEGRRTDELSLPSGFAAFVVAEGLSDPRTVTVDERGRLWVTEGDRALVLSDTDGDGFFEQTTVYADGFVELNGLALSPEGDVYLSHRGHVARTTDADGDDVADEVVDIIGGLPNGRHQNNGIAFGPDGKLYITNGSTCNDCEEADERSATILQANPDGSDLRVYARGLRNPYSLTFDPQGRLWAGDNGSDPPCNTIDELNLIVDGGDYGWPYSPECDSLAKGIPPVADLGFNTASTGLVYYDGDNFPAEYRGNIFITLWGSLELAPVPGGRFLARVILTETDGTPTGEAEEFVTGLERPVDVETDRDGSLLLLDYGTGKVYRIVYEG
jgi:putative membrane-bound dehydrogenase-like protein